MISSRIRFVCPSLRMKPRGVVGLVTVPPLSGAVLSARAAARLNSGMVRYMGPQHAVLDAFGVAGRLSARARPQSWVVISGVPAGDDETADEDMQRETIAALLKHYVERSDADGSSMELNEHAYMRCLRSWWMPGAGSAAGTCAGAGGHPPHVGELARLLNRIEHTDIDVDDVYAEPLAYARRPMS